MDKFYFTYKHIPTYKKMLKFCKFTLFFFLVAAAIYNVNYALCGSEEDTNKKSENDENTFGFFFSPFGNQMTYSPFGLFNVSPFDTPIMDSMLKLFNFSFNENMTPEFNVTHPNGNLCHFLIEWKKGILVDDVSVHVDVGKRLLIVEYSHEEITENKQTKEKARLEEYIHESCLVTDEVIKDGKAMFAVKDEKSDDNKVQVVFPLDESYVKSESDTKENNFQIKKVSESTRCVKNMRNGKCNEYRSKSVTTPQSQAHTAVYTFHNNSEDDEEDEKETDEPTKSLEKNIEENEKNKTEEEDDQKHAEDVKKVFRNININSFDSDENSSGVHVSSVLPLSRRKWEEL